MFPGIHTLVVGGVGSLGGVEFEIETAKRSEALRGCRESRVEAREAQGSEGCKGGLVGSVASGNSGIRGVTAVGSGVQWLTGGCRGGFELG